jgi:acetoin utilization deacetylase AcuC-like enzyme
MRANKLDSGAPSDCGTFIFTHPACLEHDPGPEHPERPERLRVVLDALRTPEFASLHWRIAPQATIADLQRVHDLEYLAKVEASIPAIGLWNLNADTIVSPGSRLAALHAAGAVCAAVDAVCAGEAKNAFCAVRPPGHHAESRNALGFCIYNNLAIGAQRARHEHGIGRIAIVDFDAHHGNGAQNIFWGDRDVFVASLHQWPFDLPTGDVDERGAYNNVLNLPLPAGTGSVAFRAAVSDLLAGRLREFKPELIMVAAGFDAHRDDPLANLQLDTEDYRWVAKLLLQIAREQCEGRFVASLEGGYELKSLRASVTAFVQAMAERDEKTDR